MIAVDEYKKCESDKNKNPDDLYAFDSHFHLYITSRKIFGSIKTAEEVLNCISVGHPKFVGSVVVYSEPLSYPKQFSVLWVSGSSL